MHRLLILRQVMAGSLLLLLDDITLVLDDVAVMAKVAAKKTAGVLGDDLALNAQQVTGVNAERELPVVWAVAKGSLVNKVILVPAALAISAIAPMLITPLLMIGGLFLCFEGVEKVTHQFAPQLLPHEDEAHDHLVANADDNIDLVAFEQEKIKGAIRTDFILSAEIVVISLGTMATATFLTKALTLSLVALAMTVGVYGLVAMIVKMDDVGVHLLQKPSGLQQKIGAMLLAFAPKLMKFLSIAGTLAMFLVGGGILVHGVQFLHHSVDDLSHLTGIFAGLTQNLLNAVIGFIAGALVLALVLLAKRVKG